MTERRAWSLARWLTRVYLASTVSFVLLTALVGWPFIHQSIENEIDSIAEEEMDEVEARLPAGHVSVGDLEFLIADLQRQHPEYTMAWRVKPAEADSDVLTFGSVRLLDAAPTLADSDRILRYASGKRWVARQMSSGYVFGLAIDGSGKYAILRAFLWIALVLVATSLIATLLVSRYVFRRVSGLLHEVAEGARSVRPLHEPVHFEVIGAPDEILELTDALRETLERIQREAEEARVFTAGIAHELRSPVQNLVGETEVALIADRDAATYRNVLASHLEELRRLGDAIDNLVTICSKHETRRTVEREQFDLAQESEIRMRRERALAERTGLDFALHLSGETRIDGDREAILRALRNLVQNAIQWSPAGGRIDIDIAGNEHEIVITVDDAGPGVPAELRSKVFEPFFRGPSARGRRIGYGLGLALARAAALDQGGEVSISESPLGGARVRMRLPKAGPLRAAS